MENKNTNPNLNSGECCPKKIGRYGFICLVCLVLMLYLCYSKSNTNIQVPMNDKIMSLFVSEPEPPQFFLSLVSPDYMQDEISYAPRFVQGKNVTYIALAKSDSIILFTPSDKMSDMEYNKWLGRSKAAYEYVTGKVE